MRWQINNFGQSWLFRQIQVNSEKILWPQKLSLGSKISSEICLGIYLKSYPEKVFFPKFYPRFFLEFYQEFLLGFLAPFLLWIISQCLTDFFFPRLLSVFLFELSYFFLLVCMNFFSGFLPEIFPKIPSRDISGSSISVPSDIFPLILPGFLRVFSWNLYYNSF